MFVLPVIDLMQGVVVHGRGGQRDEYQAVRSVLTTDARPASIARAFSERLGLQRAYVADLDAIAGDQPDWDSYAQIAASLPELWIDAGVSQFDLAKDLTRWQSSECDVYPICALETLASIETLQKMIDRLGPDRLVVSLDLRRGRVRSQVESWNSAEPSPVASQLIQLGARRMIVLDVTHVGSDQGTGTRQLTRDIKQMEPSVELICGGGIGSVDELIQLADDGCSAALIATALHDGRLGQEELRQWA